jgi:hypothetical protein
MSIPSKVTANALRAAFQRLLPLKGAWVVRSFGMDVHRSFAQIAVVEDGSCWDEGLPG